MLEMKGIVIVAFLLIMLTITLITNKKMILSIKKNSFFIESIDLNYLLFIVLFWLLAISIQDSYDIDAYRWAYNKQLLHGKEPLFDILQLYFNYIDWSFDEFKALWVTIVAILLYTGVKEYCESPHKVISLALITVLTGFVTQMRSAIVCAIFLNAFRLIILGRFKDKVIYVIIIIFAAQIHMVGYCFLLFLLIEKKKAVQFKYAYYITVLLATLVALFISDFASSYIYFFMSFFLKDAEGSARALDYFQGNATHFRFGIFLVCKHLAMFLLTNKACEFLIKKSVDIMERKYRYEAVKKANSLMLVFLPITILSASFERLFNCFSLIQYAMVFEACRNEKFLSKKISLRQSLLLIMICSELTFFLVQLSFSPDDLLRILNSIELVIR